MSDRTESRPPTDAEKMRLLPWSLAHGLANAVFAQLTFFGPVFILFLDELGLPKTRIGLLLSFMPFSGLVALFIAPAVARAGVKRVFVLFWGLRKAVTALLIPIPWVLERYGADPAFLYVAAVVALFALSRAIAETAFYPWYQEIVPNAIRGQYSAVANVTDTVGSIAALAGASFVIDHVTGLQRFTVLLGIGVLFGIICVACALPMPGGTPRQATVATPLARLGQAWQDRSFRGYLSGLGLVTLSLMVFSFVPLFMREEVGLREDQVLLLQVGVYVGGMLSSFLWGWAADRYGSRPVAQLGLFLMALLPIGWLLLPRHHPLSFSLAMGLSLLSGVASFGWYVSNNRLLFVGVVPPERRTEYMALYYAWIGLLGGLGPLLGGAAVDACAGLDATLLGLRLNPYAPLFAAGFVGLLGGRLLVGRVRTESAVPTRALVRMFVRGNPFMAFRALIRYRLAGDEQSRIETTQALGEARSPLNVEELLEALADPSPSVRHEAIVAIARTRPHPRLTAALTEVLAAGGPDLAPAAAWALGRIGDPEAGPALAAALTSGSEPLQVHAARALGQLNDRASVPLLLSCMRESKSVAVRRACASALGQLRCAEAVPELLGCLAEQEEPQARVELALAVARLLDQERPFVRLWRRTRTGGTTPLAQELDGLVRRSHALTRGAGGDAVLVDAVQQLAEGNLDQGAALLATATGVLTEDRVPALPLQVLRHCGPRLTSAPPTEVMVLWLAALRAAVQAVGPEGTHRTPGTG